MVCASLAGIAIGGPLLSTMGLSFIASMAILLVSTPLLLLFSPIIFFAGLVLVGAVAGFSMAALMAMSGLSTLEWVFHQVKGRRDVGFREGSTVRERGKDWLVICRKIIHIIIGIEVGRSKEEDYNIYFAY